MTEILRTRDCVIFSRGPSCPVRVSALMLQNGWAGGQGVQWVDTPSDDFAVTYSDGLYGGFALWGSNESSDQFTAFVGSPVAYGCLVLCIGNWTLSTSSYERYTYASRQSGPLVALTYAEGDLLRFSLRGLWTKEDELTLSGDPRAPNNTCGYVMQRPSSLNNNYLSIQTSL